jgi:CheY-like chemotaxis protein
MTVGRADTIALRDRKLEAIGHLAGGLAHDLNNLLTIVLGNLQLVKRRVGDAPGVASRLEAALGASARASELTRRLLGLSHFQPMRLEEVDVGSLVTALGDELRRTWGPSIAVEVKVDPGAGTIRTDRSQLEAALASLCTNAQEAMSSRGRLRLEVRRLGAHEPPPLPDAALAPGGYVAIEIHDDGPGMAPQVLERAFDPFFTTKPLGNGAGLGLGTVHGYSKRAQGAIALQSAPGQGTSAILYLPAQPRETRPAAPCLEPDVARAAPRARILVVEDDEDIREFAASVLRDGGFEVWEAGDGRAALEILRSERPLDLLLTDVLMPGGVNGRQVADEARASRSGLRILFTSGYVPDALCAAGGHHPAPPTDFLSKPYSADELLRCVHAVFAAGVP